MLENKRDSVRVMQNGPMRNISAPEGLTRIDPKSSLSRKHFPSYRSDVELNLMPNLHCFMIRLIKLLPYNDCF